LLGKNNEEFDTNRGKRRREGEREREASNGKYDDMAGSNLGDGTHL
jgi:hypothetical protein